MPMEEGARLGLEKHAQTSRHDGAASIAKVHCAIRVVQTLPVLSASATTILSRATASPIAPGFKHPQRPACLMKVCDSKRLIGFSVSSADPAAAPRCIGTNRGPI